MPFQSQVNVNPAPGVAGDFASANPRHSALSVAGGFIASPQGLNIACFAWADTATGTVLSNSGVGVPTGFVSRMSLNALTTAFLAESSMTIPAGKEVGNLFDGGDFWVKNQGAGAVTRGMKAFANNTNGTISFAAAGSTVSGSTETAWMAHTPGGGGELIKMSKHNIG